MKRITQPNNPAKAIFNKESRLSYFDMLKQAHKNLSMVDYLQQRHSMKALMNNQDNTDPMHKSETLEGNSVREEN